MSRCYFHLSGYGAGQDDFPPPPPAGVVGYSGNKPGQYGGGSPYGAGKDQRPVGSSQDQYDPRHGKGYG